MLIMKTSSLLVATLFSVLGTSAFAQSPVVAQVKQDNAAIRQETREIRADNHAIRQDTVTVLHQKQDVRQDRQALQVDRHARNVDQHRENVALSRGDLAGAQRANSARLQDQHAINSQKRDLHQDRRALSHARHVRHDAVVARNEDRH
ncbi:hypothetical protein IMCC9480_2624 [Oxalobacteraceae bacterium IMCC9480]|nr:hypothetical protein IMCC9480_2624 [Oxalobacteraceae bacterium IMCC9480]